RLRAPQSSQLDLDLASQSLQVFVYRIAIPIYRLSSRAKRGISVFARGTTSGAAGAPFLASFARSGAVRECPLNAHQNRSRFIWRLVVSLPRLPISRRV